MINFDALKIRFIFLFEILDKGEVSQNSNILKAVNSSHVPLKSK